MLLSQSLHLLGLALSYASYASAAAINTTLVPSETTQAVSILAPSETGQIEQPSPSEPVTDSAAINCGGHHPHLSKSDCKHLQHLGFTSVGVNAEKQTQGSNSIWIGKKAKFHGQFKNKSGKHVILVAWNEQFGDGSSFVQSKQPRVTVSLGAGDSVDLSFADGVKGGWSALYPNTKMANGQVGNTWGEFSTGSFATVDVSRLANMQGTSMHIKSPNGCENNMHTCVFECKKGNTCYLANTYKLVDCASGSQPGANHGGTEAEPSGGCQGWDHHGGGGKIEVTLE